MKINIGTTDQVCVGGEEAGHIRFLKILILSYRYMLGTVLNI